MKIFYNYSSDLITPDSWRTEPVVTKKFSTIAQQEKSSKKTTTTATEIISKRTKTDIEEPLKHINQRTDIIVKPKRDTSLYLNSVFFLLILNFVNLFRCYKTICDYYRKNTIKTYDF